VRHTHRGSLILYCTDSPEKVSREPFSARPPRASPPTPIAEL
jgi:hypothetical protein